MYKEIGSNFWKEKCKVSKKDKITFWERKKKFIEKEKLYFSNGRTAILSLIQEYNLKNKKILMPGYTCETVIIPFKMEKCDIFYYNLNLDLSINIEDFNNKVKSNKPDIVLVHSYYGKNTLENTKKLLLDLKKNGVIIIEDITQSLFSNFNHCYANFYVGSFRKWAEIPDGGYLIGDKLNNKNNYFFENRRGVQKKIDAFQSKYEYIENNIGNKNVFLNLFSEAEMLIGVYDVYKMAQESNFFIEEWDIEYISRKRKNNYKILFDGLKNSDIVKPVFNTFNENEVPLYFPIYCMEHRDLIQNKLKEKNIYAPIIWEKPIYVFQKLDSITEKIYENILAIPCDQRYGEEEMKYIIQTIMER